MTMSGEEQNDVGKGLVAVLDYLGIEKAHIAVGGGSIQAFDLIRQRPQLVTSLTFLLPPPLLDEAAVQPFADRLLCITSTGHLLPNQRRSLETLRGWQGVRFVELPEGYPAMAWSDVVKDNVDLVVDALVGHASSEGTAPLVRAPEEGEVEDVRFRVEGTGPPLLLFPLGLAPTQWDAALPALNRRFTTIRLGGKRLGFIQVLEERAAQGTYIQGVRTMFDLLGVGPTDRVLEVGAGTGALARDLASRPYAPAEIVGVDVNEFLLDEARFLARDHTLKSNLRFEYGDAQALPFEDGSFDVAYAATVFEECDADKGIAELHRVLKPGGRAGVIVRSGDLPRYWNLDLSERVRRKVNAPYPESVAAAGCTDASLYRRFAGRFPQVRPAPFWRSITEDLTTAVSQTAPLLDLEEEQEFRRALEAGRAAGTAFAATPFHCVVGVKR